MVIDAELFAPESSAIDPGDPNDSFPCETVSVTLSKPPATNEASAKVIGSPLADEKMNAVFSLTVSLAGALIVGGPLTVIETLADAPNWSKELVKVMASETEPAKPVAGVNFNALMAAFKLATVPLIVIEAEPLAPETKVRPVVELKVSFPLVTDKLSESEVDEAPPSVTLIDETVSVAFSFTLAEAGAVMSG